jgi:GNAT superfamily N-acetyltransferase
MLTIVSATTPERIEHVRTLLREYERSLGVDLAFQGFAHEVAGLPGVYAPPRGRLLLAMEGDVPAGCVALRPITDDVCEMKRLYLRPSLRGKGAGRTLAGRIMDEARAIGYRTMRLDSLPAMKEAIALYEALGFRAIAPYYTSPVAGTVYLERTL